MKKFAFTSTNTIKEYYNFLLNKERTSKYILDLTKISGILLVIIICSFFYFKYVSLSSTEGYWLRKANSDLSSLNFKYEIVKTELLEKNQANRSNMFGSNQTKTIVEINPEIVQVPAKTNELTYNK